MSKVLVIDDDPMIVAIYQRLFRAQGFDVETASDGPAGLAAFHRAAPDVVLLDINIPGLDGIEWLQTVRHEPRFATFPVVVLTAGSTRVQVMTAWNVGATCVLLKSRDDPQRVLDVVRAIVGGNGPKTWARADLPGMRH